LNNGEEDPELLFLYGKALFQVAVSKNGLFGGSDEQDQGHPEEQEADENDEQLKKGQQSGLFQFSEDAPLAEEDDEEEEENNEEVEETENDEGQQANASNEEVQYQEDSKQEEQSDFEIAWEILDLSRSLFEQKIENLQAQGKKVEPLDDPESSTDILIQTKLKLSDILDLLGEISLETENFKQAAEDFETLLKLRQEIYKFNSNLISEVHYKLSLALEFNFENAAAKDQAIHHLKKAIESIKHRETKDEDLVKELQLKLEELARDPNEQLRLQKEEILKGILGEATSSDTSSSLPASSSTQPVVNDLTSIVKKRKPKPKQPEPVNKKPKN
jgi:HAT1-interacting factor 1